MLSYWDTQGLRTDPVGEGISTPCFFAKQPHVQKTSWANTAGNVHQTQEALKLLCSHTEMEPTASMLQQKHQDAAEGCEPLQLKKEFPPIYFQIKISNFMQDLISPLYVFNSEVSSDEVKKN